MDDIFYFNSKEVSLKDIKKIAEELDAQEIFMTEAQDALQITYCDSARTDWVKMSLEEFPDPDAIAFLTQNKIRVIFCISYHPAYLQSLKKHIVRILEKYGGLIGMDSDGFYPYYDLKNIDSFVN